MDVGLESDRLRVTKRHYVGEDVAEADMLRVRAESKQRRAEDVARGAQRSRRPVAVFDERQLRRGLAPRAAAAALIFSTHPSSVYVGEPSGATPTPSAVGSLRQKRIGVPSSSRKACSPAVSVAVCSLPA